MKRGFDAVSLPPLPMKFREALADYLQVKPDQKPARKRTIAKRKHRWREVLIRVFMPWLLFAALATAQEPALIPSPYLAPQYLAPPDAPSRIIVAGKDEPGERLIVTGRAFDGTIPVAGVSVYVFHTDADGFYARGMKNLEGELNPRLHGALRTDSNGQYQYETIRPGRYGKNGASHVHYVVRAQGYKPRLMDLWFDDDPILAARRKAGEPEVPDTIRNSTVCRSLPDCVAIRPVMRDASGFWHSTRDLGLIRE